MLVAGSTPFDALLLLLLLLVQLLLPPSLLVPLLLPVVVLLMVDLPELRPVMALFVKRERSDRDREVSSAIESRSRNFFRLTTKQNT